MLLNKFKKYLTRSIKGFSNLEYKIRLKNLNLDSELLRLKLDLIFMFKIFHNYFTDINYQKFFKLAHITHTRGHAYKIHKCKCKYVVCNHLFFTRICEPWNSLPNSLVMNNSLTTFKSKINHLDFY